MFFNLIIFILMFSSQAFADATSHFAGYTGASAIDQFQTVEVNGNVGIGTNIPSATLSINGLGNPTSISLNSNPGNDSNTELLLHLDNNVTDISQNSFTVTNTNMTFSSLIYKFGGYSGSFNGTSTELTAPNNAVFNFGSSNFTIDFWMYITTLPTSGNYYCLVSKFDGGANNGYGVYVTNTSGTYQMQAFGENGGVALGNTGLVTASLSTNTWYHVAWVRNGNAWNLYLNGTSIGSASSSGSIGTTAQSFTIGVENETGTRWYTGYLDEFRVSNIARWTSNFNPPTSPYGVPVSQVTLQDTGVQKAKLWMDGNDSDKFKIDDATATRLTISSGNVGIGTINPGVLLDVTGTVRIQSGLITNGTAPTISTGAGDCGTSPSVVGNDISGTVTVGSGANGGQCTVTFSAAKSSTPNCICQNSTTANLTRAASQSTTSFACTGTLTAGDKLVYWCPQ
jgi:hypothetical protein